MPSKDTIYSDAFICRVLEKLIDYYTEHPGNVAPASFLSFHGFCPEGQEMPLVDFLRSIGYVDYSEAPGRVMQLSVLPAGRVFPKQFRDRQRRDRREELHFAITLLISVLSLVISVLR